MKRNRSILGVASAVLGLALLAGAGYISGEPALGVTTKNAAVPALAVGGGVLTFVVGRRLLTSSED